MGDRDGNGQPTNNFLLEEIRLNRDEIKELRKDGSKKVGRVELYSLATLLVVFGVAAGQG